MIAKDMDESKQHPPGRMVAGWPAFKVRVFFAGRWSRPRPMNPFSRSVKVCLCASGMKSATMVGDPYAEVDDRVLGQFFAILLAILVLLLSSIIGPSVRRSPAHRAQACYYSNGIEARIQDNLQLLTPDY